MPKNCRTIAENCRKTAFNVYSLGSSMDFNEGTDDHMLLPDEFNEAFDGQSDGIQKKAFNV